MEDEIKKEFENKEFNFGLGEIFMSLSLELAAQSQRQKEIYKMLSFLYSKETGKSLEDINSDFDKDWDKGFQVIFDKLISGGMADLEQKESYKRMMKKIRGSKKELE